MIAVNGMSGCAISDLQLWSCPRGAAMTWRCVVLAAGAPESTGQKHTNIFTPQNWSSFYPVLYDILHLLSHRFFTHFPVNNWHGGLRLFHVPISVPPDITGIMMNALNDVLFLAYSNSRYIPNIRYYRTVPQSAPIFIRFSDIAHFTSVHVYLSMVSMFCSIHFHSGSVPNCFQATTNLQILLHF